MSAPDLTPEDDRVRQLVRAVRKRIVAWKYPPRFQLIEDTLAREFGVSRSPMRQALTHLTAEGLVEHLPRRGFRVRQMQLRDVEDLYEFRLALELQVVHALAQKGMPPQRLLEMQSTWQDPATLVGKPHAELAALDEDFHEKLAMAHGNRLIHQHMRAINERLLVFRELDFGEPSRLDSTCDEHSRILRAIEAHDAALATDLMRRNIASGLENVEAALIQLAGRAFLSQSEPRGESP